MRSRGIFPISFLWVIVAILVIALAVIILYRGSGGEFFPVTSDTPSPTQTSTPDPTAIPTDTPIPTIPPEKNYILNVEVYYWIILNNPEIGIRKAEWEEQNFLSMIKFNIRKLSWWEATSDCYLILYLDEHTENARYVRIDGGTIRHPIPPLIYKKVISIDNVSEGEHHVRVQIEITDGYLEGKTASTTTVIIVE